MGGDAVVLIIHVGTRGHVHASRTSFLLKEDVIDELCRPFHIIS